MDQTTNRSKRTQTFHTAGAGKCFADGMTAYAMSQPQQLHTLCRLSAAAVLGILLGIFCFYFFGAAGISDMQGAADGYMSARAFSSYTSMQAYLAFYGAWFSHHALLTLLPLCTVITVYPLPLCYLITVLRGVLCGYCICMLTGTFSAFTAYMTAAQLSLCALYIYLGTKCIRYASRRGKCPQQQNRQISPTLHRLLCEAAPLTAAVLLTLTAQALGQLLISCACTMLTG